MLRDNEILAGSQEDEKGSFGGLFIGAFFLLALILAPANPANASGSYTVTETVETIEYEIVEPGGPASSYAPQSSVLGEFGPFRIVAPYKAEMVGTVDSYTPQRFQQMMRKFPGIKRIEMIDCDGSVDEEANLALARMIRNAGISTHVPANGSVRSGAVELFLSGITNTADAGAEFVVHSWMDEDGLEANDYPPTDPVHAEYLDYYQEMGVPADKARAFYALTNSVPFSGQLRLSRSDLVQYSLLQ